MNRKREVLLLMNTGEYAGTLARRLSEKTGFFIFISATYVENSGEIYGEKVTGWNAIVTCEELHSQIPDSQLCKTLILTEEKPSNVGRLPGEKKESRPLLLWRYAGFAQILHSLWELISEDEAVESGKVRKDLVQGDVDDWGLEIPILLMGAWGKNSWEGSGAAVRLARAREEPVLLITLEPFADEEFPQEDTFTLDSMLYYALERRSPGECRPVTALPEAILGQMICQNQVCFLPPSRHINSLCLLDGMEWKRFLQSLLSSGGFSLLLLWIGEGAAGTLSGFPGKFLGCSYFMPPEEASFRSQRFQTWLEEECRRRESGPVRWTSSWAEFEREVMEIAGQMG